jgi:uncharacterized damage-inducible protein DinB
MTDLRYPIGTFSPPARYDAAFRRQALTRLETLPDRLRDEVATLDAEQLNTPYRPGGWTVRQLVHHVADSHMNAYIRLKLALTEESPLIKAYDEAAWADLSDTRDVPIEVSLDLLDALHMRMVALLRGMNEADHARTWRHPASAGERTIDVLLATYAWHGDHHLAHVQRLKERNDWD